MNETYELRQLRVLFNFECRMPVIGNHNKPQTGLNQH
jgi:hypothetical protein